MNYFNYFTEIEEHFWQKRGVQVLISPVDWDLIATWQSAGIPLPAVLAGIDAAFEKFESARRRNMPKPRSLVYCASAVLDAAEAARAAAVGATTTPKPPRPEDDAFSPGRIRAHLQNATAGLKSALPDGSATDVVTTLERLLTADPLGSLEQLERVLTACDEKLLAVLLAITPVETMVGLRTDMERDLAPYRRRLRPEQLVMIERQFMQRRLLEHWKLPRLSLFYLDV